MKNSLTSHLTHMHVIATTTDAYMQLIDKIETIAANINQKSKENQITDILLNIQEGLPTHQNFKTHSADRQRYQIAPIQ